MGWHENPGSDLIALFYEMVGKSSQDGHLEDRDQAVQVLAGLDLSHASCPLASRALSSAAVMMSCHSMILA